MSAGSEPARREVKEGEPPLLVLAPLHDPEVVRLDVPMGHALLIEEHDRVEEIGAEPIQEVEAQRPLLPDLVAERIVRRLQPKSASPGDRLESVHLDDGAIAEPAQRLVLGLHALRVLLGAGDLEHFAAFIRSR
jgi:hypothetical protein